MHLPVRPLSETDLPGLRSLWNAVMVHDQMSQEELREVCLGAPDYEAEGALAVERSGALVGLALAVAPRSSLGLGRILAVCAQSAEQAVQLIGQAERFMRERGVTHVVAGEHGRHPGAPGTDVRYREINEAFRLSGYKPGHSLHDMEIALVGYSPTPYQQECRRRAEDYGVRVIGWAPELASMLQAFVERAVPDLPEEFFWPGWEWGPHMVVALRDDEVLGYANYGPELRRSYGRYHRPNSGSFGPIGVLREHRGYGIGTWLLSESQLRVAGAGRDWLWAGWTNTPFYVPNGWQVCRHFAVWEKALAHGE